MAEHLGAIMQDPASRPYSRKPAPRADQALLAEAQKRQGAKAANPCSPKSSWHRG